MADRLVRVANTQTSSGTTRSVTFTETPALDSSYLLVAVVQQASNTTFTVDSGWTEITAVGGNFSTNCQSRVYVKRGDGVVNSFTITPGSVVAVTLTLMAFSGYTSLTPLSATTFDQTTLTTTWVCPEPSVVTGYGVLLDIAASTNTVATATWDVGIQNGTPASGARMQSNRQEYISGAGNLDATLTIAATRQGRVMQVIMPLDDGSRTVTVPLATVTSQAYAPAVSAMSGSTVAPPLATIAVQARVPVVSANATVTPPVTNLSVGAVVGTPSVSVGVGVPLTAVTAQAYAPAVAASVSASVNAVRAQITTAAIPPLLSASSLVTAVTATVSTSAPAPSLLRTANVAAVGTQVSVAALPPVVSGGSSVAPPVAALSAQAFAPALIRTANIVTPLGVISVQANAPTIFAGGSALVSPPAASVGLAGLTPSIQASSATVAVKATASLLAIPPSVSLGQGVAPPRAQISIVALPPAVTAGVSAVVSPPVAGLAVVARPPSVGSGDGEPVPDILEMVGFAPQYTLVGYAPTLTLEKI